MTKKEILIGAGGFIAASVIAGTGWLAFGHLPAKGTMQAKQTVGDHTISLSRAASQQASPGGLSVATGTSLGQLNAGQTGQQSPAGGSGNGLDPSSFKQYDKYKEGQSGLYADVDKGGGAELTVGKKAAVVYQGWLTDGTLFDQSRTGSDGKLQPLVFTEGEHQVIIGWEQAIAGMKVGGTRLLIIPPAVGYGEQGQGPIPGNAVLVFLVKLLDVQ